MNTKILNKKGIAILLAIILVLVMVVTSVVSVYMITSSSAKTETKLPSEDNGLSGVADSYKGVKPIEDGAVPGGSTAYKQQFAGNTDWKAINNEQEMRNWLANNEGKNAYLNTDLNNYYPGVQSECIGAVAPNNPNLKHDVGASRIFDGCGYNIKLILKAEWKPYSNSRDVNNNFLMGLFVNSNYGTMRNINITNTQLIYIDDAPHGDRDDSQKFVSGILVARNQGNIYNCKVTVGAAFRVDGSRTNYSSNDSFVGGIAGLNAGGTIANCTVVGAGGMLKAVGSGDKWGLPATTLPGAAVVGGAVGLSENASEYNITVDGGGGLAFEASLIKGTGYVAQGGAIGRKKAGVLYGVLTKGVIGSSSGGAAGVAVGNCSDGTQFAGIYSDGSSGIGNTWMVGNGDAGYQSNFTLVRTNLYGVTFDKPEVFDDIAKVSKNLVIVPSTGLQPHEIVWAVKYAGAGSYDINNLATEMIHKTDVVKIPHVLTKVKDYINVEYGSAVELDTFTIPEKTYNGQPQGAENGTLIFKNVSGGSYTRSYSQVSSMGLKYTGTGDPAVAPKNRGAYPVTTNGQHVDNDNKILFSNTNNRTGLLTIKAYDLTYDASKISLVTNHKVYDGHTYLQSTELNRYPTGVNNEYISWLVTDSSYDHENVGTNKINLSINFLSSGSIVNNNYTIGGQESLFETVKLDAYITQAELRLDPTMFSVENSNKIYDGTTAVVGQTYYPEEIVTTIGDTLRVESVAVAYTSKNVKDAKNIAFSVVMENSNVFGNYQLMNGNLSIEGSIAPYELSLNWDSFANEAFYNADGTSNIRKTYDGTTALDPATVVVNNVLVTPLNESLLIAFTQGLFASKDVGNNIDVQLSYQISQTALGTITMPNGTTQEITADWGNYNLTATQVATTVSIDAKEITITDSDFALETQKKYDGTTALTSEIVYNPIQGVNGEVISLTDIRARYATKNVSDNNQITVSFKQTDRNYKLTIEPIDNIYSHYIDATILPYNVSVEHNSIHATTTKVYDGNANYVGDTITIDSITVALAGGEETIEISLDKAEYAQSVTYSVSNTLNVHLAIANANFSLDSAIVKLRATIEKFALKLSADKFNLTKSKVYDGNNKAVVSAITNSIIGVNGEVVSIANVTASYNDINVLGANAITITYTIPDIMGVNKNYKLGDVDGILVEDDVNIQPKEFVITNDMFVAFDATKAYDGNTSFSTVINTKQILTGINTDELVLNLTEQLFNNANVADANTLTVKFNADNANYTINDNVVFTATITPYVINDVQDTAFTVNGVKVYDGTTDVASDSVVANSYATNVNNESVTFTMANAVYDTKDKATASSIALTFTVDNTNYALGNVTELIYVASITAKDITVALDNLEVTTVKDYDKTTVATISVKNGGIASGVVVASVEELVSLDTLSATYNSALVADANTITIMFNTNNTNYNIINASEGLTTTGTINKLSVSVGADNFVIVNEKEYNGNNIATVSSYNIEANQESLNLDDGYSAVFDDKNVATNKTITVTFDATWDNYELANSTVVINNGIITARNITINPSIFSYTNTKVYDTTASYLGDAITATTINTGIGEETITLIIGEANYNSKNVLDANAIIINVSQTDSNYAIVDSVSVDATITPYQVSDTMDDMSRYTLTTQKDYDGSDSAAVSINEGFENITGLQSETFTYSVLAKYASTAVGQNIAINIIVTSNDGNYMFLITQFLATENGSISNATLTVTIENFTFEKTKAYDGTTKVVVTGYSIIGISGESVALAEDYRGEFSGATVGMGKTITIYFAPAEAGYNFDVSDVTFSPAEGEECGITKRTVTLSEEHFNYLNTKVYDGTTSYDSTNHAVAPKGAIATGVGNDTIDITVATEAQYFTKNVGDGNYIYFNVAMAEHENYEIVTAINLVATITAAPINVANTDFAFSTTKAYDGNTTVTISQLTINGVNGESITLDNILASYDIKDVGATTITITFGNADTNYTLNTLIITVQEGVAITPYIINSDSIQVDIVDTKTYDGNTTAQLNSVTIGVTTGESVDAVNGVAIYDNKNAATDKTITVTFAITDANYKLGFDNITFNNGVINAKDITVGAEDITVDTQKTYDGTTAYVGAVATHGIINGVCGDDVIGLAFGNIVYNTKDVMTANNLTVNFTQADTNYNLTNSYVDKVATIIAKEIIVSEQNFTFNKSRVYNNAVDVAISQNTINGVNGETITLGTLLAQYNSKNVADANAIIITVALGDNDTNYTMSISTFTVSDELVFLTPYIITADMVTSDVVKTKTYDANATVLVNGISIANPLGEEITAIEKVASYDDKNAAIEKVITVTFAIDNGNYQLDFESIAFNDGVIVAKEIAVAGSSITVDIKKEYDGNTNYIGKPAEHSVIEGACGDDVITLEFGNIVYNTKDVMTANALTVNFTQADTNYVLTNSSVDKGATIVKKAITLTENDFVFDRTRVYNNAKSVSISQNVINGVANETINLGTLTAEYDSKDVAKVTQIIITVALGENDSNYKLLNATISVSDGVAITPYVIGVDDVSFSIQMSKVYDATTNVNNIIPNFFIELEDDELSLSSYSGKYDNKNVGQMKDISFTFSISNTNYILTDNAESLTATGYKGNIVPREITPNPGEFEIEKSRQYTGDNTATSTTTTAISGINGEKLVIVGTDSEYTGEDHNVGDNKTIRAHFALGEDDVNKNYIITQKYVDIKGCEIVKKQITVTADDFDVTKTKVYDGEKTVKATAKLVQGVLAEQVTLAVTSSIYDEKDVATASAIKVTYKLVSNETNSNYVIANELNYMIYDDEEVSITRAQLTVEYGYTSQSYRNNPDPASRVTLRISAGAVKNESPRIVMSDKVNNPGTSAQFDIKAVSQDSNYYVSNGTILVLDVFAKDGADWLIESLEDFEFIATDPTYLGYDFKQTRDIDVKYATISGLKGVYTGRYNGNDKFIKNLFLYDESLFETIKGTVENLAIVNATIISYNNTHIGGIAKEVVAGGTIRNSVFEGSIYLAGEGVNGAYVGGIAATNAGTITSVKVFADITVKANNTYVGGIVGLNSGSVTAETKVTNIDINRVFVQIQSFGTDNIADAVVGDNATSGTVEQENTMYLNNASFTKNSEQETISIINSNYGKGVTFAGFFSSEPTVFGELTMLMLINQYHNDYGLVITPNMKLEINNAMDYELLGQYNYLNAVFKSNIQFFKHDSTTPFNKLQIGDIDMNGFTLDERIVQIFAYMLIATING